MNFNTWQYIAFLFLCLIIYYIVPSSKRYIVLLFGSIFFYGMWDARFIALIFSVIVISYTAGYALSKYKKRGLILLAAILLLVGLLGFFKYTNFIISNINGILGFFGCHSHWEILDIILPVGISFYIFQAISYVADCYKGTIKPEKHFLHYALYIMFFPQLVAGPIERASDIIPQTFAEHKLNEEDFSKGLKLLAIGLFKKICVADSLAVFVDQIWENYTNLNSFTVLLGTLMFSIQIYCDFSGYSDIARGSAKLFGYDLSLNFFHPYFAESFRDFWRRWHVTLTKWLTDYVYKPLGGGDSGTKRKIFNIMIVFVVSGIWHGAAWTFVLWGICHGILRCIEEAKCFRKLFDSKLRVIWRILVLFFVNTLWIVFRSNGIRESFGIITRAYNIGGYSVSTLGDEIRALFFERVSQSMTMYIVVVSILVISLTALLFGDLYEEKQNRSWLEISNTAVKNVVCVFASVLIIGMYWIHNVSTEWNFTFIYFQF